MIFIFLCMVGKFWHILSLCKVYTCHWLPVGSTRGIIKAVRQTLRISLGGRGALQDKVPWLTFLTPPEYPSLVTLPWEAWKTQIAVWDKNKLFILIQNVTSLNSVLQMSYEKTTKRHLHFTVPTEDFKDGVTFILSFLSNFTSLSLDLAMLFTPLDIPILLTFFYCTVLKICSTIEQKTPFTSFFPSHLLYLTVEWTPRESMTCALNWYVIRVTLQIFS